MPDVADAADLAELLAAEAEDWLYNLSHRGLIPRAFVGVTDNDQKFVLELADTSLDHTNRLQFLEWLCRTQRVVAYAYITHVAKLTNENGPNNLEECVDIYASSLTRDVCIVLGFDRHSDGSLKYKRSSLDSWPATDIPRVLFLGLQRSDTSTDERQAESFKRIWDDAGPAVIWFRRRSPGTHIEQP
jgi:hypothetical protein